MTREHERSLGVSCESWRRPAALEKVATLECSGKMPKPRFALHRLHSFDSAVIGDDFAGGEVEEEAGFDDAGAGVQCSVECGRVVDAGGEAAVVDQVAVVGDVIGAGGSFAERRLAVERGEESGGGFVGEACHLDGKRVPGAELGDGFAVVGDDDQLVGALGDHFLAEQRAAGAFDQLEAGGDFVCAVDGESKPGAADEGGEGNFQLGGAFGGLLAGGHAGDVLESAGLEGGGQSDQKAVGGGTTAQSDDTMTMDELDSGVGGTLLGVHLEGQDSDIGLDLSPPGGCGTMRIGMWRRRRVACG